LTIDLRRTDWLTNRGLLYVLIYNETTFGTGGS